MFITTRSLTLQLGGMTKLVTNWTMKAIWYLYIDVMVACYCKRKVFSREAFPSLTWISTKAGSIVIDTKNIAELKEGPKVLILDILYINWCPSWTMMIMTSCGRCTSWARWCSQRLSTSRLQCLSDKYLLSFLLQLCQVLTSCFWYIFNSESFPAVLMFPTLFVEYQKVIDGEWREARKMREIPVAFSYFKVTTTSFFY